VGAIADCRRPFTANLIERSGSAVERNRMRRLLLLRHAKSDWPADLEDRQRPLSERGRRDAPEVGRAMAKAKLFPALALVSPAIRTRETWELVSPALQNPGFRFEDRLYGAAANVMLDLVRDTPTEIETLMLVGHNPGTETLARAFAMSGDADAIRRINRKYPTAGLAVLELPINDWKKAAPPAGRLEMFLTPKTLDA